MSQIRQGLIFVLLGVFLQAFAASDEAGLRIEPTSRGLELRQAALAGDVEAMLQLAAVYSRGEEGFARNDTIAAYWFDKADRAGSAYGAYNIGICYRYGLGVEVKPVVAYHAFRRAAERGLPEGKLEAALMSYSGVKCNESTSDGFPTMVAPDRERALMELEVLQQGGFIPARRELGKIYLRKVLEQEDSAGKDRAVTLLQDAAQTGDGESLRILGELCASGFLPGGDKKAVEYFFQAWNAGDLTSAVPLARHLEYGIGTERKPEEALKFIQQAAKKNVPGALAKLGEYTLYGFEVEQNPTLAFQLFQRAARAGDPDGMYFLGLAFLKGLGTEENPEKALDFLVKAASEQHLSAQKKLAELYRSGEKIPQDLEGAFYWYCQAAEQGDPDALREAGLCLLGGVGTARSAARGMEYLLRAARHGDRQADEILKSMQ